MRRRNFYVLGFGIPVSLATIGVAVLAFYLSLIFGIAISLGKTETILDEITMVTSFILAFAGVLALIGSIISGFFSIPGGIIMLISSLLAILNPIFFTTMIGLYSDSFNFVILLMFIPAILLWILGIWALCTKKKINPKKALVPNPLEQPVIKQENIIINEEDNIDEENIKEENIENK